VVSTADFISIDETPAYGLRKAEGDLPDIDFMHLAPGSDLIDARVNIGMPFFGALPDLGCFETGTIGVQNVSLLMKVLCYPNPLNEKGLLQFSLNIGGRCVIPMYDISGEYIKTLADQIVETGAQIFSIDVSDLQNGLYIYLIKLNDVHVESAKLVKGK
jgi:hypothetical protein